MGRKGFIILIIFLLVAPFAWAGDSVTIGMSCVIPVIPGVNAPLLSQDNLTKDSRAKEIEKKDLDNSFKIEMIKKDEVKESSLNSGGRITFKRKTIYAR